MKKKDLIQMLGKQTGHAHTIFDFFGPRQLANLRKTAKSFPIDNNDIKKSIQHAILCNYKDGSLIFKTNTHKIYIRYLYGKHDEDTDDERLLVTIESHLLLKNVVTFPNTLEIYIDDSASMIRYLHWLLHKYFERLQLDASGIKKIVKNYQQGNVSRNIEIPTHQSSKSVKDEIKILKSYTDFLFSL